MHLCTSHHTLPRSEGTINQMSLSDPLFPHLFGSEGWHKSYTPLLILDPNLCTSWHAESTKTRSLILLWWVNESLCLIPFPHDWSLYRVEHWHARRFLIYSIHYGVLPRVLQRESWELGGNESWFCWYTANKWQKVILWHYFWDLTRDIYSHAYAYPPTSKKHLGMTWIRCYHSDLYQILDCMMYERAYLFQWFVCSIWIDFCIHGSKNKSQHWQNTKQLQSRRSILALFCFNSSQFVWQMKHSLPLNREKTIFYASFI